jgi:hypothetical protein
MALEYDPTPLDYLGGFFDPILKAATTAFIIESIIFVKTKDN